MACLVAALAPPARAHDVVQTTPANSRWDVSDKSNVATFLGKDEIEVATLILKKSAALESLITVQSDAAQISFSSGDSVKVTFTVKPVPGEGATSRFKFVTGDEPNVMFEGKDDVKTRGKWIQVIKSPSTDLKLELTGATFATVKFGAATAAQPTPATAAEDASKIAPTAADKLKKVPAQKLKAASTSFADGVSKKCAHCDGKGEVTKSVKSGSVRDGAISRPTYRQVTEKCDKCNGKGKVRSTDAALNRLAGSFLVTLASLDESDPKAQAAVSEAYKMITAEMIGDFPTWALLTENGRSILSQRSPAAGTPVIAKCTVKESLPLKNGKRQYLVQIGGTDKKVVISDPVTADELNSGGALVGGLVEPTDPNKAEQKDAIAVLEQGFLIAPPDIAQTWYWWYWWDSSYKRPK